MLDTYYTTDTRLNEGVEYVYDHLETLDYINMKTEREFKPMINILEFTLVLFDVWPFFLLATEESRMVSQKYNSQQVRRRKLKKIALSFIFKILFLHIHSVSVG